MVVFTSLCPSNYCTVQNVGCCIIYADILKKTVQEAVVNQPRLQAIQLYPVCDNESGHFLVLATGWDKQRIFCHTLYAPIVRNMNYEKFKDKGQAIMKAAYTL
ncbi:XisI protein [Calothrix sp. NIES-3974]|uniref:XisI protein n=1 Tax=Calothrix sp. NIES-3974 TaxID=2005462 RepID=UPI000B618221|nr:XisI protein [Calothrix sp. NIES-3974]BAZ07944.1 hypothetical protein NIES3974_46110 [Calothrix sp. NIES-3974]